MIRLLAVAGAVVISFSAILVRLAEVSPSTAAFYRTAYALPVLLLVARLAPASGRSAARRGWTFAAGALLGVAFTVWNYAIGFIGAGLSTVLGNTQVVFVGLAAWLIWRERPSNLAFVAIPVVFAGVIFASGLGGDGAYGSAPVLGAVLSVANALVYASFLLLFRGVNRGAGGAAGPLLDATAGAALVTLLGGLVTDPGFRLAPGWPAHGWLAVLAFGPQVLGWFCITLALPRLPALETSVILLLQPVLAVIWALLIFQEFLSPVQWAGVALVLGGVALLSLRGSVRRAPRPAAADGAAGRPRRASGRRPGA